MDWTKDIEDIDQWEVFMLLDDLLWLLNNVQTIDIDLLDNIILNKYTPG